MAKLLGSLKWILSAQLYFGGGGYAVSTVSGLAQLGKSKEAVGLERDKSWTSIRSRIEIAQMWIR